MTMRESELAVNGAAASCGGPHALQQLDEALRWVAWRQEKRPGTTELTKVPYAQIGRRASTIDPNAWSTRARAARCFARMQQQEPGIVGGIGIVLGDLGNGYHLCGIDLDKCINKDTRDVANYADEIISRFATYTEISPSQRGAKLLFLITEETASDVAKLMGGKGSKVFAVGEHCGIELHVTARFFTITDDLMKGVPDNLRVIETDDVRWLLQEAVPTFLNQHGVYQEENGRACDSSRSAEAFRFFIDCKRQGMDYSEARAAIRSDAGAAGEWAREKAGAKDERVIRLTWDNAPDPAHTWDDPDVSLLDDERGELPAFPVEMLRSRWLQEWVARAAEGTGTTIDHVAVPLLGIASSLIGTTRRVRAASGWSMPMTVWAAVIGFSGTGKTPGIGAIKGPLDEVDNRYRSDGECERREHERREAEAKAVSDAWKKQCEKAIAAGNKPPPKPAEADAPPPFIQPRLYVTDATIERVCELLAARPSGLALIVDELSGWLQNMSRYSGGRDDPFWLMAYDGHSYSKERVGQRPINLDHLLVGIIGGMQPDKLSECFKKTQNGMYARFLFTWPLRAPYRPLTDDFDEVDRDMVDIIDQLARLRRRQKCNVELSQQAREEFECIRRRAHAEVDALTGREREWWAKIETHVLRLAGTLAFLNWAVNNDHRGEEALPEPGNIKAQYIKAAGTLVFEYFWPHARACLRQIGVTQSNAEARVVLRFIRAKGLRTVRREDIRRDALSQRLDADATDKVLGHLVRAGWLRRVSTRTGKRGRPAMRFEVNSVLTGEGVR